MNVLFYTRKLAAGAAIVLLGASAVAQTASDMVAGEVRKVDKAAGKITLKHGDIKNLDMPAMTMVFQVRDPAWLDKVEPGDKVRFSAESREGAIVVTAMEAAP
jgi:Cu/Ag efflux protein CusF